MGGHERLQSLALDIAKIKPALIVATPVSAIAAAAKAAPDTPIIAAGGDVLASGLVSNLSRPGGRITGVSDVLTALLEKHIELLLDAMPKLQRIGIMLDPNVAPQKLADRVHRMATRRSVDARVVLAGTIEAIEPAASGKAWYARTCSRSVRIYHGPAPTHCGPCL